MSASQKNFLVAKEFGMGRNTILFRITTLASLLVLVFVIAQNLPAGFKTSEIQKKVFIDGVDYGVVANLDGLQEALASQQKWTNNKTASEKSPLKIQLRRDFITEPSLYHWAQIASSERSLVHSIEVVSVNSEGMVTDKQLLQAVQPLSWSLEAANLAQGGYHEVVEIAIQEIVEKE